MQVHEKAMLELFHKERKKARQHAYERYTECGNPMYIGNDYTCGDIQHLRNIHFYGPHNTTG